MDHGTVSSSIVNALTVDVEDYYHVSAFEHLTRGRWADYPSRVERNTERLLELLASRSVRATFFVLGWVAQRHPALVRRVHDEGHEIAAHGYLHRLVYDQSPQEFRDDVRRTKAVLESICGAPVIGYRAPSYSITSRSLWALDILLEEGFAYDTSIFPIHHDRYGIPTAPRHAHVVNGRYPGCRERRTAWNGGGSLIEIPASTVRLGGINLPIAGGAYFRLLPYGWTCWGISRVNVAEGKPVVFYIHPWEIDPCQPRLNAGWLSTFRHYRHLDETENRLRRLLSDFRFTTISEALLAGPLAVIAEATAR